MDGLNFKTTDGAKNLKFSLLVETDTSPVNVVVGAAEEHPATNPFILPAHPAKEHAKKGARKRNPMSEFRLERDSMGAVRVPANAYYGAQTQRAIENFPISGEPLAPELIHALGLVKYAAAVANRDFGKTERLGQKPTQ